ncbi:MULTISPECIES: hypothetical protein [Burkholderia]|uniref:hypothetical protein n=1 Tax=Burkholderia TaxID=32008 RepID=UPI000B7A5ED2|nr:MULTISPECIES: hypothetical protein [Burkholderia]MBY4727243.1 hypothetical protein [Burkholderia contaminans]MCI3969135.1 hypothetical protein [Burkholderia sp. HI4860]MCI3970238.1 hypothetical protein [Burkholderia sp. HI4860]MDN7787149.1 hypothetical protein [Burkholderia contaminans]OXI98375.1 hypothetical protein CFB48_23515 [Burkholderia sp. AU33647]
MKPAIKDKIEVALSQSSPEESLRQLVIDLNDAGVGKLDILKEFNEVDQILRSVDRDEDADILEDVIDMMTGYYVGKNLDLK